MVFVVGKDEMIDGKKSFVGKMYTEHSSCVYPAGVLKDMERAGYRFKVDGKYIKAHDVWKAIDELTKK